MKLNVKKILFIVISFLFLVFVDTKVNAASAKIECSGEVEVNKPITISVKGSGVQWNLKLIVDGNVIATSRELDNFESNKTINFSKEYTPTTVGNKTIKIEGSVTEFSDGSTITNFEPKTLKVNEKKEDPVVDPTPEPTPNPNPDTPTPTPDPKPVKVKLQSLKINSTTYIKQLKTNLSVTVEGQEDITLLPKTSDGSSCKITNSTNKETKTAKSGSSQKIKLNEGTNKITVTGSFDETYTITVINKKKEEETPPNVIEEPTKEEKVILKSLSIKGVKSEEEKVEFTLTPEFSSEVYEYNITIPEEQNDITKLDIEAIGDKEDFTVEITGNENLVDGENIVTILVKSKDGEKTTTYQIKVNKEAKVVETVTTPVLDVTPDTGEDDKIETIKMAIVVFTTIIAIAGIVFALIEYKYGKKNKKETSKISYAGISDDEYDDVQEEAYTGTDEEISYSSIGFEKEENGKEDILEDLRDKETLGEKKALKEKKPLKHKKISKREKIEEDYEEETFEVLHEEEKPRSRGKHF